MICKIQKQSHHELLWPTTYIMWGRNYQVRSAHEDFKIERKYFRENITNSQISNILLDVENIFVR